MASSISIPAPLTSNLRRDVRHLQGAMGVHAVGYVLCAVDGEGLCAVLLGADPAALREDLQMRFNRAACTEGGAEPQQALEQVLAVMNGHPEALTFPLHLVGTPFEQRVWAELMTIDWGQTRSYGAVARALGVPGAARAVGRACGSNNLGVVVPCHRVVHSNGQATGYRWGPTIKQQLLAMEERSSGRKKSA